MRFLLILILLLNITVITGAGYFLINRTPVNRSPLPDVIKSFPDKKVSVQKPVVSENNKSLSGTVSEKSSSPLLKNTIAAAKTEETVTKIIPDEPARIKVISSPPDSKVFVNGYYKGKTPVEVKIMSAEKEKEIKLVIIKLGYERWEKHMVVEPGKVRSCQIVLKKAE